jgi:hypothetical protein
MNIRLKTGTTVIIPVDEIRRIVYTTTTGVRSQTASQVLSSAFRLLQNYPNPFNPATTIVYEIPEASDVTVRIFALQGALIRELSHGPLAAGRHQVIWDGTDERRAQVSGGAYFSVVQCGEQILSRRLILLK